MYGLWLFQYVGKALRGLRSKEAPMNNDIVASENVRLSSEIRRLRTRLKAADEGLREIQQTADGTDCSPRISRIVRETLELIKEK